MPSAKDKGVAIRLSEGLLVAVEETRAGNEGTFRPVKHYAPVTGDSICIKGHFRNLKIAVVGKGSNTGSGLGGGMAFENRREAIAFPRKPQAVGHYNAWGCVDKIGARGEVEGSIIGQAIDCSLNGGGVVGVA